ncbi:MAG: hypothetical protein Fur0012_11900 [Elusimicrobiota bacterium]
MKKLILTGAVAIILVSGLFAQLTEENRTAESTQTISAHQIGNKFICPVTGEEFTLTKDTPKFVFEGKTYYFCCEGCAEKFGRDYQKKFSVTTDLDVQNQMVCPVMGTRFVPNSKSPKTEYKGKTYYFCCPGCVEKFNKEPEKYINKSVKSVKKHQHREGEMCDICDEKHKGSIKNEKHKHKHDMNMMNKESKMEMKNENHNMMGTKSEKIYAMEEVTKHNKKGDCWLVINDKVYDVSEFSYKHNENILLGCGKDATKLFETRTTDDGKKIGSGTRHSENAHKMLEKFYKGDIYNNK